MLSAKKYRKTGIVLTISGPDGCGKTTLINDLLNNLERQNIKLFRSRPIGFPILSHIKHGKNAKQIASAQNHFSKNQSPSRILSIIKFTYYFLDYFVGGLKLLYLKRLGKIVIFDRYYFDYICDQTRFSVKLNSKVTRYLYNIIYEPDINVYLLAKPDLIHNQKVEQSKAQIRQINIDYVNLFSDLQTRSKKSYHIVPGLSPTTTKSVLNILDAK